MRGRSAAAFSVNSVRRLLCARSHLAVIDFAERMTQLQPPFACQCGCLVSNGSVRSLHALHALLAAYCSTRGFFQSYRK